MIQHECHLCPSKLSARQAADSEAVYGFRICTRCEQLIEEEAQRRLDVRKRREAIRVAGCIDCGGRDETLRQVVYSETRKDGFPMVRQVVRCADCDEVNAA